MLKNYLSEELLNTYGWEKVDSKNPVMFSYRKDTTRMNYYFTTGTITFQDTEGNIRTHYEILNDEQMEEIISKEIFN